MNLVNLGLGSQTSPCSYAQRWLTRRVGCSLALLALPLASQAASVSFYLDITHAAAAQGPYLEVTLSDSPTVAGDIDVTVRTLRVLTDYAGPNFGIDKFFLNIAPPIDAVFTPPNLIFKGAAADWRVVQRERRASQFGEFDVELKGTGGMRTTRLEFTLTGLAGDSLDSYASLESGHNKDKRPGFLFAAHVGGLHDHWSPGYDKLNSAYFAGSTFVPLPAAAWLFLSGLLGMVLLGRGRRSRVAAH